jgi:L-rhamnose isomerase
MSNRECIERAYIAAKERYAVLGVDTAVALAQLEEAHVSLPCWQGDDVCGFEGCAVPSAAGIAVTGGYLGRARNAEELRQDLAMALRLIPGTHRVNLHASYAETGGRPVDRDQLAPIHFQAWMDWAKERQLGLDFNPTFFSHALAAEGLTLSHPDRGIREFWIEHGRACRRIGAAMGLVLNSPCVTNVWIPDGAKDAPVDRRGPRRRLQESLDTMFAERYDFEHLQDAVEAKLFGIGSESYVVGSHEFYLGYAITRGTLLCLDSGHFHPTEQISDKISAVLSFVRGMLLHISRGVRWDSDHVPIFSDDVLAIAQEIVRGGYLDRVHIGLDFFDASLNRVAAWVIGARAVLKALLVALLEPRDQLQELEIHGDFTSRLARLEELKSMPFGAVWDYYCLAHQVPAGLAWLDEVQRYEMDVLAQR